MPAEKCGCISSGIQPDQGIIKKSHEYMKKQKNMTLVDKIKTLF